MIWIRGSSPSPPTSRPSSQIMHLTIGPHHRGCPLRWRLVNAPSPTQNTGPPCGECPSPAPTPGPWPAADAARRVRRQSRWAHHAPYAIGNLRFGRGRRDGPCDSATSQDHCTEGADGGRSRRVRLAVRGAVLRWVAIRAAADRRHRWLVSQRPDASVKDSDEQEFRFHAGSEDVRGDHLSELADVGAGLELKTDLAEATEP